MYFFTEGLNGKDNLEKARCDTIVDFLKETRVELKPVMPMYLKETDEAKIVSADLHKFSF